MVSLSNTVAFWIAGEYHAKKGILTEIDLPGLTKGFTNGVTEYPLSERQKNLGSLLSLDQELETSGARDVTPFKINGEQYLAIPQLAYDNLASNPSMNGGTDAHVLIFKKSKRGKFELYQSILGHHNESAEFFEIKGEKYLAVCSVSSGSKPPYNHKTKQILYKWDGLYFQPVQKFDGYAAKSWSHFSFGEKTFLGLANGVVFPKSKETNDTRSHLFQWDGEKFEKFQSFDTSWAYKFSHFSLGEHQFLGLTDHVKNSVLYKWNGENFIPFQSFDQKGGRVFYHFKVGNTDYLALANIFSPSKIYRWNNESFELVQTLDGLGGRNFLHFNHKNKDYLLKVVFITGTRENPKTQQKSPIYLISDGKFEKVSEIQTSGAVAASKFSSEGKNYIAVANSLSEEVRFAAKSDLYQLS